MKQALRRFWWWFGDVLEVILNILIVIGGAILMVVVALVILFFIWWGLAELGIDWNELTPHAGDRKPICQEPPSESYWMVYEDRTRGSGWAYMDDMNAEEEAIHCPHLSQ